MVVPPFYELPPRGYGGIELVVAKLIDALVDRGHDVTLIGAGRNGTKARFRRTYADPQHERLGQPLPEAVHAAAAAEILQHLDVDLVHDHTLLGPLQARGRTVPTVATVHGPVQGEPGRDNMEVLLVAVKRDKVNDYTSVISQTGKTPVLVDVDAFAIQNCYEVNYDLDPLKTVALINMGAGVTNINVLSRGATVFWRDISFGGNQFTEALQREFNLSFEQAEQLKRGEPVDRYTLADARPVLDAVSAEMASEIHKTFDFFSATSSEGPVDQIVLSGGCSLTPNLEQVLRERFEVPVERMDPLRRIHYRDTDFNADWLHAVAPTLAVAVGLAVRKVGD